MKAMIVVLALAVCATAAPIEEGSKRVEKRGVLGGVSSLGGLGIGGVGLPLGIPSGGLIGGIPNLGLGLGLGGLGGLPIGGIGGIGGLNNLGLIGGINTLPTLGLNNALLTQQLLLGGGLLGVPAIG